MHTKLSTLKNYLFNGVLDPSYRFFLSNGELNQRSFLLAFFPLGFLRQEENRFITEVRSNNSSRLSNIFNRITDAKRNEGRFRKRFMEAFNQGFYQEMLDSSKFFLRNYDQEKFNIMIETIISEDEALSKREHIYIKHYIVGHRHENPEKSLSMLFIWAFHISSFLDIIEVIKRYELESNVLNADSEGNREWLDLMDYLKTMNVKAGYIKDYIEIVKKYGISGQLGAIALHTYIETTIDVNPLIYCEVANNLYYGNHYEKSNAIKSLNYFQAAANTGYGPALWTMGQMTNHSRHQSNRKNAVISKEYYKRALSADLPLSLNNLGILYYRSLVYLVAHIKDYHHLNDCFRYDSASGISEIYYSIKDEASFVKMLERCHINELNTNPKTKDEEYETLKTIECAERDILTNYFVPAYEVYDYFYAVGSAISIYESQFNRYKAYYNGLGIDFSECQEYKRIKKELIRLGEFYSNYFCTECHYTYSTIVEKFEVDDLQNAYEHYYIAAFETPQRAFRFHAFIRFLELHYSSDIMNKKQVINPEIMILKVISQDMPSYNPEHMLVLRAMELLSDHLDFNHLKNLNQSDIIAIKDNLSKEMTGAMEETKGYQDYLKRLQLLIDTDR